MELSSLDDEADASDASPCALRRTDRAVRQASDPKLSPSTWFRDPDPQT
jgi:hypothetical protein